MNAQMPRPNAPLVQGGSAPMDRDWLQWVRDLAEKVQSMFYPPPWRYVGATGEPAFKNSWTNYGSLGFGVSFRKSAAGQVEIRGFAKSGTINTAAFTLPDGYRPSEQVILMCSAWNGAAMVGGMVGVSTAGDVYLYTSTNNRFHLDGASFWAD